MIIIGCWTVMIDSTGYLGRRVKIVTWKIPTMFALPCLWPRGYYLRTKIICKRAMLGWWWVHVIHLAAYVEKHNWLSLDYVGPNRTGILKRIQWRCLLACFACLQVTSFFALKTPHLAIASNYHPFVLFVSNFFCHFLLFFCCFSLF